MKKLGKSIFNISVSSLKYTTKLNSTLQMFCPFDTLAPLEVKGNEYMNMVPAAISGNDDLQVEENLYLKSATAKLSKTGMTFL